MAGTFNAALSLNLSMGQAGVNATFGGPFFNGSISLVAALANGTIANKFDLGYIAERSVNASSNDDIDINGVLTDSLGNAMSMVELAALLIVNAPKDPTAAANLSTLTIGGGSNPVFTALPPTIPPGGAILLFGPSAAGIIGVTAATADILRIANGAGGTNKYQIAILGRSA